MKSTISPQKQNVLVVIQDKLAKPSNAGGQDEEEEEEEEGDSGSNPVELAGRVGGDPVGSDDANDDGSATSSPVGNASLLAAKKASQRWRRSRGIKGSWGGQGSATGKDEESSPARMTMADVALEKARMEEEKAERERIEKEKKDKIDRERVGFVLDKWKVRKTDKVLDLSGKNFLDEEIELIGMALMYTDTYDFSTLSLSRQSIVACKELRFIFDIGNVGKSVSLTAIDLSNTKVADEGCKVLQHTLVTNKTLTSLDLRNCEEITDEGAACLLSLIMYVPKPKEVKRSEILGNTDGSSGVVGFIPQSWNTIYDDILDVSTEATNSGQSDHAANSNNNNEGKSRSRIAFKRSVQKLKSLRR